MQLLDVSADSDMDSKRIREGTEKLRALTVQ